MPDIGRSLIPFLMILMGINAMFMFMSYLPASQADTTQTIQLLSNQQVSDFNSQFTLMQSQLVNDFNQGNLTQASSAGSQTQTVLGSILTGIGKGVCSLPILGIGCQALGLAGTFVQWIFQLFFGYVIWVDWFINPNWGYGLPFIGLAIKAVFFFITIKGALDILLPIFGWSRWGQT